MQLLCVGGAFLPIASLYSNFVVSQGKSQLYMWNTIVLCLAQLLLLVILHPWGVQVMVAAYVGVNTLWLFVWHRFVGRMIGLPFRDALRDVVPFAVIAAVSMLAAWLSALPFREMPLLSLTVKMAVAAVVYFALLRLLGAQSLGECMEFLKSKVRRKPY